MRRSRMEEIILSQQEVRKEWPVHEEMIDCEKIQVRFIVNCQLTMDDQESIAEMLLNATKKKKSSLKRLAKKVSRLLSANNRGKRGALKTTNTVIIEKRTLTDDWWTVKIIVYHKNSKESPAV